LWRQAPALQFRPLAQHDFLIDQTQRRIEQLQEQADELLNKQEAIELLIRQEYSKERRDDALITRLESQIARLDRKEELVRQELFTLIQVAAAERAAARAAAAAATAPRIIGLACTSRGLAFHFCHSHCSRFQKQLGLLIGLLL